jgi:hypothetical protein
MIEKILKNQHPPRFAFAPNYWQWFAHHKNHGILPKEIQHCETQVDLINYLGLDIFSRNSYCEQSEYWFGGICEECFDGLVTVDRQKSRKGTDTYSHIPYKLRSGYLTEELRYVFNESTVVQSKFLIKDYTDELEKFEEYVHSRNWKFNREKYQLEKEKVGKNGVLVVGDFFSPLKMLHITLGPVNSVYFLVDHPETASRLMGIHEKKQLSVIEDCLKSGVRAVMSMDNLDSMFHPPDYVEKYSASFYSRASEICDQYGAKFFIHACGNQKEILELISSLGVHGLEGVSYPPLGNVTLKEAFEMTGESFIITGGISSIEYNSLKTRQEIFAYVKNLFNELKPYKNRFIFSASCNTPINAPWESIKHFRDAWVEYRGI